MQLIMIMAIIALALLLCFLVYRRWDQENNPDRDSSTVVDSSRSSPPAGDELLAIVHPRGDLPVGTFQAIGQALHAWQTNNGSVRRIVGLEQLDAGQRPRSPALHCLKLVELTEQLNRTSGRHLEIEYWSAVIVLVAPGSASPESADSLLKALEPWVDSLSFFWHAADYEFYTQ